MSWDATLIDDRGHWERDWNYTHNCNGMIEAALADPDLIAQTRTPFWVKLGNTSMGSGAWFDLLDGMSGGEGRQFLDKIINGLKADPDRFRAMNPDNGWGDYDSLLTVLIEMRDAVPDWPTAWSVSG